MLAPAFFFFLAIEPGLYIWNVPPSPERLPKSVEMADRAGFHAVRLLLSPAARRDYGVRDACADLACLAMSEPFEQALSRDSLHAVMFTAYDFASYRGQRYLDLEFLHANREKIFDEYRRLTEELMRRYSGSHRVFVIGHWEGDNQVYCGSSFNFLTDEFRRKSCQNQNLEALTEWLRIRQSAIASGRERAHQAGAKAVEVYHAVEFNSIHHFRGVAGASLRSKDYHGVLDTVIPAVRPDFCSYSGWESLNSGRLQKDLKFILERCAPARLLIGELGYRATEESHDPAKPYHKTIETLQRFGAEVPYVFFWQAFDRSGFGLLDEPRVMEEIQRLGR